MKMHLTDHLAWVVVLLLLGAVVVAIGRYNDARGRIAAMESTFRRAQVHDRLTGAPIDLAALADAGSINNGASRTRTLLWILDPANCQGCFNELGGWLRLERLDDHRLILLLVSPPTVEVRRGLRVLRRTEVIRTSPERMFDVLGSILPSTKLLLDRNGIAILVDSRSRGKACGWSFNAQVGAIVGLNDPGAIRIVSTEDI